MSNHQRNGEEAYHRNRWYWYLHRASGVRGVRGVQSVQSVQGVRDDELTFDNGV